MNAPQPCCPGCLRPYPLGQPECRCGRALEAIEAGEIDLSGLPPLDRHGPPPPPPTFALRVEGSEGVRVNGVVVRLVAMEPRPLLIGRRDAVNGIYPEIDLGGLVDYGYTSRRHALVQVQAGRLLVTDLPGQGTTATNDITQQIAQNVPTVLQPGDRLIIGEKVIFTVVQT